MTEQEEQDLIEEESHYHAVLADMAELMTLHGTEQVIIDLLDISVALRSTGSNSFN
jgi:hypothetical protein|tara:strand:+ start:208 stop:375 length:168 start_codon:yes stop_codon:yes gene_type:complete